jgi:hypothetical protein
MGILTARKEWRRTLHVAAPAADLLAFLADPTRLPSVHPLIDRIDVESDTTTDHERTLRFVIHEHVPLGPLRVKNRYRGEVRTRADAPHGVVLLGWSTPAVTVRATWTVTDVVGGCIGAQHVVMDAPRGLASFVFRTAARAHDAQLEATRVLFTRS